MIAKFFTLDVYMRAAVRVFLDGVLKLGLVVAICIVIILISSAINTSPADSLLVLTDPGFLAELLNRTGGPSLAIIIVQMIIGIILMGAVVSVITETVLELATVRSLATIHRQLKRTFRVHKRIATRKLLKGLGISAETRNLPITMLDEQLRITKDQISRAIDLFGGLRLRYHTVKDEFVVENIDANASYGTYNHHGRSGRICVVSTQSSSDAGVGHFAKTLSDLLDAHFVSNEYFSSGSLLPERQINFASNERYADFSLQYDDPHGQFINDVLESSHNADIVVYVGTVSEKRKNDLSILFGGKAGIVGIVEHPHVDDQVALMRCIEELRVQTEQLSLRVGTHEEVGNASADHLTSALRRATQKNIINVQVNTRLLWKAEDTIYYSIIHELSNAIKIYCTHIGSSC